MSRSNDNLYDSNSINKLTLKTIRKLGFIYSYDNIINLVLLKNYIKWTWQHLHFKTANIIVQG